MNFKEIVKNVLFSVGIFAIVIAMGIMARKKNMLLSQDDHNENDTVNSDYTIENITEASDKDNAYLNTDFFQSTEWNGYFDDSGDAIEMYDKDIQYYTQSNMDDAGYKIESLTAN